jgi:superfamily II DNA or RNA helicase/HKD family nuclease
MSNDEDELPFGLYERLVTAGLKARLLRVDSNTARIVKKELDPFEAHTTLARHIANVVSRVLNGLPQENRAAAQSELTNQIVSLLGGNSANGGPSDNLVEIPPEELRAIHPIGGVPNADRDVVAPLVALSASDLLVNARGEPGLAHALAHEIPSADSIDLLCAFVRWHGLRLLADQLEAHCRTGKPLRVITTVFTGSTERRALDWLVAHGAQVKVSYDTQSTRLHAKAWLFRRVTGYSTAYIGSSNLSKSALVDGVEWNVRLSQVGSRDILEKFDATFDTYWESPEYESYEPIRDAGRFDRAVAPQQGEPLEAPLLFLDVEPWPHQREMLEKLAVERQRHHRFKNLVVAATGTGKTIVAALDYKRLRDQHGDLRLLFVAHRQEILKQSLGAFRQVLRSGDFGELYVDNHRPDEWRHVFASIQSLAQVDLDLLDPAAFDVVIVDEFHHAAAPTYRRLLEHLFNGDEAHSLGPPPKILLGLTATPERTDAEDILHYFDNHIAVEMRLWDALERGLLCPFQYFGLHDNTDLSSVRWSRKGYDTAEMERLYTGDDARVRLVLEQVRQKHRDAGTMCALGFCVSIAHAEFMARRFTEAGLPSVAVTADTDSDMRKDALASLRAGRVRALFAVDLFNEGVDLPEVDTLLFLRPTESALVFLQQLGRGLRRHERKDCVTVLDFIGQSHRQFRFDLRYRAVTGTTRTEVEKQVQLGFPFLPAGCSMQLDRVATRIVLDNLKSAVPSRRPAMMRELKALAEARSAFGRRITLAEFLQEAGLELEDVYRSGSWSGLQRDAGLKVPAPGPHETLIGDRLAGILYVDDPLRLSAYERLAASAFANVTSDADRRLVAGFHFAVIPSKIAPKTLAESVAVLHAHPAIVEELRELLPLLDERSEHLTYPLDLAQPVGSPLRVPLSVHARHTVDDVLTAFGILDFDKTVWKQTGTIRDEPTNSDLFFVTLQKSEREYSPSTLYKDYAISPTLFHWESQSTTTQRSKTGQRYIDHRKRGGNILLFVRPRKKQEGRTMPYTFLGVADYVSHKGERPISFVWKLRRPMPADFFRQAKVASG